MKKKIILIAHRGASNTAPENTLKAFTMAIELDADYIEFDVRISKDGELIIIHDPDVFRTTHKLGFVKQFSLNKIKKLNAGNGEKIPTLEELLIETKGKINYMCEIKVKNISGKVLSILKNHNVLDSTILISFKHNELLKSRNMYPDLKLGAIIPSRLGWITNWFIKKRLISSISQKSFFSINAFFPLVNRKFVDFSHEKGLKVFAWTVNSKRKMKKLIKLGIDGILTNDISLLKDALNEFTDIRNKNKDVLND
ncbi:MAG: glycerophosphodiester phosphodiesterase [Promethearchaeota archaeon]